MKKITCLVAILIIIGTYGAGAYAENDSNEFLKVDALTSYDMVIIAPNSFSNALQPLIQHKNDHDVSCFLQTTETIYSEYNGRDDAEKIKYFIKNSIEQWGTKYVMLVGGKDEMPVRYAKIYSPSSLSFYSSSENPSYINNPIKRVTGSIRFITDLYYADIYNKTGDFCSWDSNENNIFGEMDDNEIIDHVDLYPDICIGRILCRTESEVSTVVNKIIEYESNDLSSTNWFKNLILCGGDEYPYLILEFLIPLLLKRAGRIAFEGEYMSKQIALLLKDFNSKKIFASRNIKNEAVMLTTENINNAINDGAGFLLFSTHGNPDKVSTHPPFNWDVWLPSPSGYSSSDVKDLRNEEMLPVAIFSACYCGDFDSVESPIAWEFVKHGNGGSIASLACTTTSDALLGTLCTESLLGYLTKDFFQKYSEGNVILGEIWKESICSYLNDEEALRIGAPDITLGRLTVLKAPCFLNHFVMEEWILLGDPSLKIGGYQTD